MGNPFADTSSDLLKLHSRDIADSAVADAIYNIEKLGQDDYDTFVKDRLASQTVSIQEPIKKNNLPLFKQHPAKNLILRTALMILLLCMIVSTSLLYMSSYLMVQQ